MEKSRTSGRKKVNKFFPIAIFLLSIIFTSLIFKSKKSEEVIKPVEENVLSYEAPLPVETLDESTNDPPRAIIDSQPADSEDSQIDQLLDSFMRSLETNSAEEVFDLMGSEFREIYDLASFSQAVDQESINVVDARLVSGISYVGDEFAEVELELLLSDGTISRYTVVLKLELGEWGIFGTEEL